MDQLLLTPMIASLFMAIALGLVGVLLFARKQLLIAECLSHATFPGIVIAALFVSSLGVITVVCAAVMACAGWLLASLLRKKGMSQDLSLSFTLSAFFAVGTLLASGVQRAFPQSWRSANHYLFGQAATLSENDALLFAILAAVVITVLVLLYKQILATLFDESFAQTQGLRFSRIGIAALTLAVVVLGIRTLGVVLLSAMLIAPAIAARAWVKSLSCMLMVSALVAAASALLGVALSWSYNIPTGPIVSLIASAIALLSLLFAPGRGFVATLVRSLRSRFKIRAENVLKALVKERKIEESAWLLFLLVCKGYLYSDHSLTEKGRERAMHVIRLHRLFELYLTEEVGLDKEAVHAIAEEAEHKITAEMEQEIEQLLGFPHLDPHRQPIPRKK